MSDVREVLRPPPTPAFPSLPAPSMAPGSETLLVTSSTAEAALILADTELHRICIVTGGTASVQVGDRTVPLETADALWIAPGDAPANIAAGPEAHALVFGTGWAGRAPSRRDPVRDAAGRLRDLSLWLQMESLATFPGARAYRTTLIELASREWERLGTDEMGALEKRLRAFVLANLDRQLTLDAIARHLGLGRYHLCRKYREVTGESPMHAVRAIRIDQARELIRGTSMPLRLIARRVGLRSEQHLSRLLRLHFDIGVKDLRHSLPPDSP